MAEFEIRGDYIGVDDLHAIDWGRVYAKLEETEMSHKEHEEARKAWLDLDRASYENLMRLKELKEAASESQGLRYVNDIVAAKSELRDGCVTSVTVVSGGSGYPSKPSLIFTSAEIEAKKVENDRLAYENRATRLPRKMRVSESLADQPQFVEPSKPRLIEEGSDDAHRQLAMSANGVLTKMTTSKPFDLVDWPKVMAGRHVPRPVVFDEKDSTYVLLQEAIDALTKAITDVSNRLDALENRPPKEPTKSEALAAAVRADRAPDAYGR